jgi:choline monooxygenase
VTTLDEALLGSTIASVDRRQEPVRVPTDRYTSPEFAALEHERLWPYAWVIACTVDHVAHPGDVFEHRLGNLSVVVVRGDDGELRAFQNTCLHRGNLLCDGPAEGLSELRCPYHRWAWDLRGRLREVPSRKGFGILRNDDYPLIPASVGTWGPFVFVNLDAHAEPLDSYLEVIPADSAWAQLGEFRCTYRLDIPLPCNWKTLIEAFSETYHVQGIHRELLPTCDDINSPQVIWDRHGKLEQPYGVPSPRLRNQTDQTNWDAFHQVMGTRIGHAMDQPVPPVPEVPEGSTLQHVLARLVREHHRTKGVDLDRFDDEQVMVLQQYNLFPNATIIMYADLLSAITARPGPTPDEAVMTSYAFERRPTGQTGPGPRPTDLTVSPEQPVFGLVIDQDVKNLQRAQRGLHQPGLTHLSLSGEECRIINLHRNLERQLGLEPFVGA